MVGEDLGLTDIEQCVLCASTLEAGAKVHASRGIGTPIAFSYTKQYTPRSYRLAGETRWQMIGTRAWC